MATIAVFVVIFCIVKLFAKGAIKLVLIVLVVGAFFVAFANQLGWFPEDIDNATKYGADKVGELRKKYHTTLPKDVSDMATGVADKVGQAYEYGLNYTKDPSYKAADAVTSFRNRIGQFTSNRQ
eukprot:500624_1